MKIERLPERKETIIELVQTEMNYANDLQILKLKLVKDTFQLDFHSLHQSIHVLFSVVHMRGESNSVALLGGDTDLVVLVQPVVQLLTQWRFSSFFSFSFATLMLLLYLKVVRLGILLP